MKTQFVQPVLIVDDDEDDREFIRDAFQANQYQHECVFLKDGEHLMEYLHAPEQNRPDPSLILLDLNMPRKDGREVLKELKSNKDLLHIPVVVLTTSSLESDRRTSYQLGANCFITKPNSYHQLVEITKFIAKLWLSHS